MNLNQIMGMVGRLSDQQLAHMMRENDVVPDFIVASELQRRKDIRDRAANDPPTLAQSLTAGAEGYAEGGYVRPPPGYRPGFDPEYDAWRRRSFAFDPSLVTPVTAGTTGTEANRRPGQAQEGEGGLEALLLTTGLSLLPRIPSIYRGVRDLFGPGESADDLPLPPDFVTEEQAAALAGVPDFGYGSEFAGGDLPLPPTFLTEAEAAALADLPGAGFSEVDGFAQMGVSPDEFVSVSGTPALTDVATGADAAAGAASANTYFGGALDLGAGYDFGLTGSLGSISGIGDVATGLANLGGGYLGRMASEGTVNERNPNSAYGHQIGSTLGGIIGSFIPVPVLGTYIGSVLGGVAGAGIGDQVGAPPTIGRNFGVTGTLGSDGRIQWTGPGGDNGGTADDATSFANWLGGALQQRAGQYGLTFNPNMAGVQFNVGGYNNFSRTGDAPGGFFYDPMRGDSPENYALRPTGTSGTPFSPGQANMFADAVLADMVARGVFLGQGDEQRDRAYYDSTLGADLGMYGPQAPYGFGGALDGFFSEVLTGANQPYNFDNALSYRRNAVSGYLADAERRAREAAEMAEIARLSSMHTGQYTENGFVPLSVDSPLQYQADGGA